MSTPLRVLLVEDVEDDALLVLRQLQQGGFDPTSERVDAPETMEAALRKQAWDIVIADYRLPRFSGTAALEMVKASGQDTPFILVSGAVGEQTAVEVMRAGANDYLMKDNLARLAEAVRRELGEAEHRRGLRLAEQRIREGVARAEALARVVGRLNARLDLEKVLATVCEEAIQVLGVSFATVYLYDDERQLLYPAALAGAPSEELRRLQPFPRAQYEEVAEKFGRTLVIPDVQALPPEQALVLDPTSTVRTLAFVSMLGMDELVGALAVVTVGEVRVFTEDDLNLLQNVADQAAQAIINARLYEQSRRRLRYSQALRNISLAITAVLDLRLILQILLEHAIGQLGVDAVDVLLLKREVQVLEYAVGKGFGTAALRHTRLQVGEGQAGLAALERRIVSIPDLRLSDGLKGSPMLPQERFVAYFAVPLIAKGEVKGVMEVFHRAPLHPDREWLEFMEALGGQAAIAIDNATLFDSLQRTHVDLIQAYDSTIEGWSRALDLRDKETEGHTQRVTEMTQQLARGMDMSEIELVHVRRGALLHDIGKMGIPDNILFKPGPLTAEEWEIMRRHPVYAQDLLSPIAYLRPALDIPYCHHEKWDGSGYPRGLKGDQIPLSARLFAVVDVWDALRSDRPYRPAWPEERALDHIRSGSGTHFDPKAVGAFIETVRAVASPDRTPGSSP
jgi:response regulator RpfG family c-di-GMP phosphodiesterase